MSLEIWTHHEGYSEAVDKVQKQSLQDDLSHLDALYGRDNLAYGATPEEVKQEVLRQLEIDWRDKRNELAELHVMRSMSPDRWRTR